jgi:hypothetical protein
MRFNPAATVMRYQGCINARWERDMLKKIAGGLALYLVVYGGANMGGLGGSTFSNTMREDKPIAIPAAKAGTDLQAPRKVTENVIAYSTQDEAMKAAKGARAQNPAAL